jgi:hypothetical protein
MSKLTDVNTHFHAYIPDCAHHLGYMKREHVNTSKAHVGSQNIYARPSLGVHWRVCGSVTHTHTHTHTHMHTRLRKGPREDIYIHMIKDTYIHTYRSFIWCKIQKRAGEDSDDGDHDEKDAQDTVVCA